MNPPSTVVLDNEPVQALLDIAHPKHRRVLALLDEVNRRNRAHRQVDVLVPVAVRVEAGWDRTDARSAVVNRVSGARDVELNGDRADRATQLRSGLAVSVVDATVGEAAEGASSPVVILTSDPGDMERLAGRLTGEVRIVRI